MTQIHSQVPWSEEQWERIKQVIQDEASRARVAATFLPLRGPLAPDTDFVKADRISYEAAGQPHDRITIDDTSVLLLPTLQVKVYLRGPQMADPEMTSAVAMFRRAANVLARLEDAVVFNGQRAAGEGPPHGVEGLPPIWEILGGQQSRGLLAPNDGPSTRFAANSEALVSGVSGAIGDLEGSGHFGPYALVLGQKLFQIAQTPNRNSLVLPQDRIIPFLGGGSLLRSSTLPDLWGVLVALGGAPVELVVSTDVSLNFLQMSTDPQFIFRVYEKIVLRIKESAAIMTLVADEAT